MGKGKSTSRFRALVEGRRGVLDFFFGVISCVTSTSMNLPPPPGPPGTYLRFFKGGPSGESTALREPFKEDLGWALDGLADREGLDIGAIVHLKIYAVCIVDRRWVWRLPIRHVQSRVQGGAARGRLGDRYSNNARYRIGDTARINSKGVIA